MARSPAAAAALLLLLGLVHLPATRCQAPPPDLSAIPQACLDGGTQLQTVCERTFTAAQSFFNVQVQNGQPTQQVLVTQAQIDQFIKQAPPPSPECCKAACEFNANYCSCEQAVLDFAVQVSGNDPGMYRSIATGFANTCGFKVFLGDTCPPPEIRKQGPKDTCSLANGTAALNSTSNSTLNGTAAINGTSSSTAAINGTSNNSTAAINGTSNSSNGTTLSSNVTGNSTTGNMTALP